MSKNTIIYNAHSWDGIFCREVALKALREKPNVTVLSWEPGDPALEFPDEGHVYVLGLPLDAPFGSQVPYDCENIWHRLTWIHNHPDAIRNTEGGVPGLRTTEVANCRLAYAHFFSQEGPPTKANFLFNEVEEPYSLRLVQDQNKHVSEEDTTAFFRGLSRLQRQPDWNLLLSEELAVCLPYIKALIQLGGLHRISKASRRNGQPSSFSHGGKGGREDSPADREANSITYSEGLVRKMGRPSVQACPIVTDIWPIKEPKSVERPAGAPYPMCSIGPDTWPIKDEPEKLQGCGQGVCAICGSTTSPLHVVDYADKPLWICLGGCKRKDTLDGLLLSHALLQRVGDHFEAHRVKGEWTFRRIAERQQTVDELVCEQGHRIKESPLYPELIRWLDDQHVTSNSIGSIRRRVLLPWNTEWNEIVRAETAAREHSLT
jgi:hypothetical protein